MPLVTAAALLPLGARPARRSCGDASLRVWELGHPDGEPWVLLHGLGSTALAWRAALSSLRADCRVLVPELSALGGTRCPGDGLNVRDGTAAILELIADRFPGRRVSIAGISLGGWMAVRAVLSRPELFERLVLVAAAGYRDQDWERIRTLVTIDRMADVDRFYRALFVRPPLKLRWSRRLFLAAYSTPAVRRVLATIDEPDVFDDAELARLELPVGLIWGERDGLFPVDAARAMALALPRSQLVILPDCAHGLHWERPRRLSAAFQHLRRSLAPGRVAAPPPLPS